MAHIVTMETMHVSTEYALHWVLSLWQILWSEQTRHQLQQQVKQQVDLGLRYLQLHKLRLTSQQLQGWQHYLLQPQLPALPRRYLQQQGHPQHLLQLLLL